VSGDLFGLLDHSQFSYKPLNSSFNGFPSAIQLQVHLFQYDLNIILNAKEIMNKKIITKDDSDISSNDQKLVKTGCACIK
jgi:hypothetical protein